MSETEEVSDDRKREWVWRHSAQALAAAAHDQLQHAHKSLQEALRHYDDLLRLLPTDEDAELHTALELQTEVHDPLWKVVELLKSARALYTILHEKERNAYYEQEEINNG